MSICTPPHLDRAAFRNIAARFVDLVVLLDSHSCVEIRSIVCLPQLLPVRNRSAGFLWMLTVRGGICSVFSVSTRAIFPIPEGIWLSEPFQVTL